MTTGVSNLDNSIDTTNIWLNDILKQLQWQSKISAYQALRGTLHALRDRLPIEESAQLAAQLPLPLKGVYYDGWKPVGKPEKYSKVEFARKVHEQFDLDPDLDLGMIIRAVLRVMYNHMGAGELKDVRSNLPKDMWEWFPEEIRPAEK
ncbi:DUF2267 domain-containing protein [Methanolobus halotolerans]|uniref:DUF2267 domain-containing protein n=1 Tax=Methanolobus halotolerans TaxID=2052935 RepID=UPI001436B6C9|nr:DUF2267 domain-containing protein [Methanolobus halotolerans]